MTKRARINARIDAELARKIAHLERATGASTTRIVRESIELYYETVQQAPRRPGEVLKQSGFVGCAQGPAQLSSDYKRMLSASLTRKHG